MISVPNQFNMFWSQNATDRMADAFGREQLAALIETRVQRMMISYAGGHPSNLPPPPHRVANAAKALGVPKDKIISRINTMVCAAVGMSVNQADRVARRQVLVTYAKNGIRTLSDIRKADMAAKVEATEQSALAAKSEAAKQNTSTGSAVASRTIESIAADLRRARARAVELSEAAKAADLRVNELRSELLREIERI